MFPDSESVTRLIGSVLLEQHEEWQYGERRYLSQTSLRHLTDMLQADNSASDRAALPRYLVGGPGWSGAGPAAVGMMSCPCP